MSKSKKYNYKIIQESASCWNASIVRQVSSKKINISKQQSGFATEADAKNWAETELENFRKAQVSRNTRRNEQRKLNQSQREERASRKAAKTAAAKAQNSDSENISTAEIWNKKSINVEESNSSSTATNTENSNES